MPLYQLHPDVGMNLPFNRVLTCGEQDCQVGNHPLAVDEITRWLEERMDNEQQRRGEL